MQNSRQLFCLHKNATIRGFSKVKEMTLQDNKTFSISANVRLEARIQKLFFHFEIPIFPFNEVLFWFEANYSVMKTGGNLFHQRCVKMSRKVLSVQNMMG